MVSRADGFDKAKALALVLIVLAHGRETDGLNPAIVAVPVSKVLLPTVFALGSKTLG
jgi:hypothetical protein